MIKNDNLKRLEKHPIFLHASEIQQVCKPLHILDITTLRYKINCMLEIKRNW